MSIEPVDENYVREERVQKEAKQWGCLVFGPAQKKLGHDNAWDPQQVKTFAEQQRADGTACLRAQKNNNKRLYGQVFDTHWTVNALLTMSSKEFREKAAAAFAESMFYGIAHMRTNVGFVRHGAGGKIIEKADLAYLQGVHMTNAKGEANLHGHVWYQRYGILESGRTYSLACKTRFFSYDKDAQQYTQLAFADKLEQLGVKVSVENGKVVIPELLHNEEAKQLVGSRKREAKEYLEKKGIRETPWAMDTAIYATRPNKVPHFDKTEREAAWEERTKHTKRPNFQQRQKEEGSTGVWGRVFKEVWGTVADSAKVLSTALVKPYSNRPGKVLVKDVSQFIQATKKKSLREGHRAALRALKRTNLQGLDHALTVAERAFKKGRRPEVKFARGTSVLICKTAAEAITEKERSELNKLAAKNGWQLKILGQQQQHEQSQKRGY